jgi:hypothetical protein
MRRLALLALLLNGCAAFGLAAFSPNTQGTHSHTTTSRTATDASGQTVTAPTGMVFVGDALTNSRAGAVLGIKFGPTFASLDGKASDTWKIAGTFHLDPVLFFGSWGVGAQLEYGTALALEYGQVTQKYGGFAFIPVVHRELAGPFSLHAGAGWVSGGVGGDTASTTFESATGYRGVLGLTISGSDSDRSYGYRLELAYDHSGDLPGPDHRMHVVTGLSLMGEFIYGAF